MSYGTEEIEAIGLCIALEAIGDIANHSLLKISELAGDLGEAEIRFHTHAHQELFLIRLLDFAKERGEASLTGVSGSCLDVLKSACQTKAFESNGSASSLTVAVDRLSSWLNERTPLELWLPSLDLSVQLVVPRIEFLHLSGNQAKHNLSRLTVVSKRVALLLKEHGHDVPIESLPLALDDFREHLEHGYFIYYGTWITELLNNIRWGIQEYLTPTYALCLKVDDDLRYHYEFPDSIKSKIPREWFWRLMNHVRRRPYFDRFSTPGYLKSPNRMPK